MTHPVGRLLQRTGVSAAGVPVKECGLEVLCQHRDYLVCQLPIAHECSLEGRPIRIGEATFTDPVKAITEIHKAIRSVDELISRECPATIEVTDFAQWEDGLCHHDSHLDCCHHYERHGSYRHYEP